MSELIERSLLLGEREVSFLLRRSRRRTLGMSVDHRGLVVAIPLQLSLGETEAFIRAHGDWVLEKLNARTERVEAPRLELADGVRLPVLGEPCALHWVPGLARARWMDGGFGRELHLPQRPGGNAGLMLKRVLRDFALTYFSGRLDEYLFKLADFAPDVARPRLALTAARTRWGSCSSRSGIRLHWRLVHLEPELIDYVVAHEVGHLVEMNHSPRFWSIVAALCPDWRVARVALRQAGRLIPEF